MFGDTVQGLKRMVGVTTSKEAIPSLASPCAGVIVGGFYRPFAICLLPHHVCFYDVLWYGVCYKKGCSVVRLGSNFRFYVIVFCFPFVFSASFSAFRSVADSVVNCWKRAPTIRSERQIY